MRQNFAIALYDHMKVNPDIFLLTGDLGYGLFDHIRKNFPDRFINTGAAEQCMIDMAIGLALSGKIPVVYSITPFLLHRPYESIKLYLEHEQIAVILVGSGREKDYEHDGISHWMLDIGPYQSINKIPQYFPVEDFLDSVQLFRDFIDELIKSRRPAFISLKR